MTDLRNIFQHPVRSDSLAMQVFTIIKEAIFSGKFQPGETLRELHLAKKLEVSQATVREALVQLEQAGLAVRIQNRKTSVASFTPDEVRDRIEMRLVLEELAFLKAAERMSSEECDQLRQVAREITDAAEKQDCQAMTFADMRFHRFVWERAGSSVLLKTLDQLTTPLFAFLSFLHISGMHDLRTGESHEALIEVLRSRSPELIREAIRRHIEGSYQKFIDSGTASLVALMPEHVAGHAAG